MELIRKNKRQTKSKYVQLGPAINVAFSVLWTILNNAFANSLKVVGSKHLDHGWKKLFACHLNEPQANELPVILLFKGHGSTENPGK